MTDNLFGAYYSQLQYNKKVVQQINAIKQSMNSAVFGNGIVFASATAMSGYLPGLDSPDKDFGKGFSDYSAD